jgi:integrase
MATFRKRGARWQAQVRRQGFPPVSKSFLVKADAEAWARQQETLADRGELTTAVQDHKLSQTTTVADVIVRYRDEVMPTHRGGNRLVQVVNAILRRPIANAKLADLTVTMANAYITDRLKTVKGGTVRRELDILRHAFAVAKKEWALPLSENVFAQVRRPKAADARERRFQNDERQRLLAATEQCRNPWVRFLVEVAVETGMRRGEILAAKWSELSWDDHTLRIPKTKNGHARTIPLSGAALKVLKDLSGRRVGDHILPISTNSAKEAWKRLAKRAGLVNFRFHDLRHEAISGFFERGLNVPEVALISGHRDPRMLFRYTHPKPELIAKKLQ